MQSEVIRLKEEILYLKKEAKNLRATNKTAQEKVNVLVDKVARAEARVASAEKSALENSQMVAAQQRQAEVEAGQKKSRIEAEANRARQEAAKAASKAKEQRDKGSKRKYEDIRDSSSESDSASSDVHKQSKWISKSKTVPPKVVTATSTKKQVSQPVTMEEVGLLVAEQLKNAFEKFVPQVNVRAPTPPQPQYQPPPPPVHRVPPIPAPTSYMGSYPPPPYPVYSSEPHYGDHRHTYGLGSSSLAPAPRPQPLHFGHEAQHEYYAPPQQPTWGVAFDSHAPPSHGWQQQQPPSSFQPSALSQPPSSYRVGGEQEAQGTNMRQTTMTIANQGPILPSTAQGLSVDQQQDDMQEYREFLASRKK